MKLQKNLNNVVDADFRVILKKRTPKFQDLTLLVLIFFLTCLLLLSNFENVTGIKLEDFAQRLNSLFDKSEVAVKADVSTSFQQPKSQENYKSPFGTLTADVSDELPKPVADPHNRPSTKPPSRPVVNGSTQSGEGQEPIQMEAQFGKGIPEFSIGESDAGKKP